MQTFFTPHIIFIATCAGFILGALWYSPLLFMKAWLKGEGVTKEVMPKHSPQYVIQINVYSFVAHGAIASVLAVLFDILSVSSLTTAVALSLLLTFGFIVTTRFIDMIYTIQGKHWELRSQLKFLVSSGYYLATVGVMAFTLFTVGTW